jgi:hypothetical protein
MPVILRQNENLVKLVRKHVIFLLPVFLTWPLIVVALILIRYLVRFDFLGYWPLVFIFAVLLVLAIILYRFFIWRKDALIITDQRVVENEQRGFFSKTVTELLYRDILEISYTKDGLAASIYNYGDIKIRTAAESEIVFEKIPNPAEVIEVINRIRQNDAAAPL